MRSWDGAASRGNLAAGFVDIWRLELNDDSPKDARLLAKLSPEEKRRAARFKRPGDRRAFLLTRAVLRELLCRYLSAKNPEISPQTLKLEVGSGGKPKLAAAYQEAAGPAALEFNVAHTAGMALLVFGQSGALGVDIEKVRPRKELDAVAREHFCPAERRYILEAAGPDFADTIAESRAGQQAFYRVWTKKEAYIKALGSGFLTDLRSFEVRAARRACLAQSSRGDAERWELQQLNPGPGYIGAVCVSTDFGPRPADYLRTMTATVSNSASVQLVL